MRSKKIVSYSITPRTVKIIKTQAKKLGLSDSATLDHLVALLYEILKEVKRGKTPTS